MAAADVESKLDVATLWSWVATMGSWALLPDCTADVADDTMVRAAPEDVAAAELSWAVLVPTLEVGPGHVARPVAWIPGDAPADPAAVVTLPP